MVDMLSRLQKARVGYLLSLAVIITATTMAAIGISPASVIAAPGINKQVNFQGKVVNSNGTNVANGTYTFRLRIYTAATGDEGATCSLSCVWEESKNLTVTNGVFQTNLGDTTALPGSVDFNSDNLYIGVVFNGDTEMTPRIRMTAVPYAFNADRLNGLSSSSFAQLNPAAQQSGAINVSGNITSGGTVQANTVDAAASGTLTVGAANATGITIAKNASVSAGQTFSILGANALQLGSTTAAGGMLLKDGTANNFGITLTTPALAASYTIALPASAPTTGQCVKTNGTTASQLEFGPCGTGSASTIQEAYQNTADGSPEIVLNGNDGGLTIRDNATPITGNLFEVQNNGATATYLGLTTSQLALNVAYVQRSDSTSAFSLQTSGGLNSLAFDGSAKRLMIYETGTSPSRYAEIYYDAAANEAVFSASSGSTRIGSGTGDVIINTKSTADTLQYTHAGTAAAAYTDSDVAITRNLSGGDFALQGSVMKIEDLSTFGAAGSSSPNVLQINQNNASATGNLILAQTGGTTTRFSVTTAGNGYLSGSLNAVGGYAVNGTAGAATTCSSGQVLQNQVVSGGITTGGTCAAGGVTTVGAVDGVAKSANGATISGNTIHMQTADGTNPGLVSTGAQTFAGAKTFSGAATFKNAADSTMAFVIQNSGGLGLLSADTTNGFIALGTSGASGLDGKLVVRNAANANTITLTTGATAASYSLILPTGAPGTGQCLKTDATNANQLTFASCGSGGTSGPQRVTLHPEYEGAVLRADGTSNNVNVTSSFVEGLASAQGVSHNYYQYDTTSSTAQDYDIVVRYQLPSGFGSFVAGSFSVWTYADSLTSTDATFMIKSATGADCYTAAVAVKPATAATWEKRAPGDPGNGCTFAANDTITFVIKPTVIQPNTNKVRIGELQFEYQ